MITTTISSKNQITVPIYMLNSLNFKKGDKLILNIEDNKLYIKPIGKSLVDLLASSLAVDQSKKGIGFQDILKKTKEIAAKKLAEK